MASSGSYCSCDAAEPFLGIPDEELYKKLLAVWKEFQDFPYFDNLECWEVTLLSKEYFTHYALLLYCRRFP